MVERLSDLRALFGDEDPTIFILAPSPERPVPAGDTRLGTVWLFREAGAAARFADWMKARHGLEAVPVELALRPLLARLAERDLIYIVDPETRFGYGDPVRFKAPLQH